MVDTFFLAEYFEAATSRFTASLKITTLYSLWKILACILKCFAIHVESFIELWSIYEHSAVVYIRQL